MASSINPGQAQFRASVAAGNNSYANGAARPGGLPPSSVSSASSVASGGMSGVGSGLDYSGLLSTIQGLTDRNNAWSAAQAQRQMDYQTQASQKAMDFEHDEAELSRQWQEYMSNTAHQREVKDLQAAGINPVLTATGGQGAPVTSGATASGYAGQGSKGDTDESGASALVSILGSMLQAQTSLLGQSMSAQNALAVADKYTAASRFGSTLSAWSGQQIAQKNYDQAVKVATINQGTQLRVAEINASSHITGAQISAFGQQAAASISGQYHLSAARESALASIINSNTAALAKKYGDDLSAATQKEISEQSRQLQRDMQQAGFDFSLEYQKNEHDNRLQLASRGMFANIFGDDVRDAAIGVLSGLFSGGGSSGSYWMSDLPVNVPLLGS